VVGQTALRIFGLSSGATKGTWRFATNDGVCNDMAVAPNGTVYATESFNNRGHRLRPGATALDEWITHPKFAAIDWIALLADGAVSVNTFFSGELSECRRERWRSCDDRDVDAADAPMVCELSDRKRCFRSRRVGASQN
jgi:hypothetical protein